MPDTSKLQGTTLTEAVRDLAANLRDLGKAELAEVVRHLESQGPLAASWHLELLDARRRGDEAAMDELERTLEVMAADAVLLLAKAGVKAQAAGEGGVATMLKLLGATLVAAIA